MASNTTIRIREKAFKDNVFILSLLFRDADGYEEEFEVQLPNPYDAKTDALLEWYFEKYISTPYDDVKVKDAEQAIEGYGTQLFKHLFTGEEINFRYRTALQQSGPENITIEVVGDSPAFQGIYWESLKDPKQRHPLAAEGMVFLRKNLKLLNIKAKVEVSPTINLLIVTARPNEENDVNYRTIQRPLIDLIEETTTPIQPHILRPGTYEALVKHLDQKAGYYHIIHFDLHGGLLDYPVYLQFKEAADKAPFHNVLYKGGYALQELKEEDFKQGKKAFIFFESEEKGTAVPVDAEQLADMLENKQIPICMLNACQSAKQEYAEHETSLGRVLMQKGMQLVLAMRYSVSVSAAKLMMQTLYQQIYKEIPIEKAIARSRKELYRDKERRATYNYSIELQDWLLPVVYQNGKPALHLRDFKPEEEEAYVLQKQPPEEARQDLPYGFFGRDLDILKIEKNLLVRNNNLLLQSMGGAGKTTLLKYLAAWWLRTGFVQKVFYFGYDIKAYSLNEIIYHIAQQIYSKAEYGIFTALQPALQENRIVKALKAHRYALMLDNTESITGEKLAIPHTLPEAEQNALKQFLSQLKGGESVVLIGSRASEDWLKSGTFNHNHYLLRGLDHESATNFAQEIIQDIGLSMGDFANDAHFERLMKLLAGYPLALKAILPNLKHKTAKQILQELDEGKSNLDKENEQKKSESIIKCIDYAFHNLSIEAQQLLLCLAPFQTIVHLSPDFIKIYFEELKKDAHFQNYPFDKFEEVVKEAMQNGFMQEALLGSQLRLISLQPVFTYFLKNKLNTENAPLQQNLQTAFINYYQWMSNELMQILANEPQQQKGVLFICKYEYENFYKTLYLLLNRQDNIFQVFRILYEYLDNKYLFREKLQITEMIHEKLLKFNPQKLNGEFLLILLDIKLKLGSDYYIQKQYDNARKVFNQGFTLLDTKSFFLNRKEKEVQINKGNLYLNLGSVSEKLKEYSDAKDYYIKALKIFEKFQMVPNEAVVNHNIGVLLLSQKLFAEAKDYFEKLLFTSKQHLSNKMLGDLYLNLGSVFKGLVKFTDAKNFYKKALKIFVLDNNVQGQGEVYQDMGLVLVDQKKYKDAKNNYENVLKCFVQVNDAHNQGRVYQHLGIVLTEENGYSAAKNYYKKALNIFEKFQDFGSLGQVHTNLGFVSKELKEYMDAKDNYEKALDNFLKFPEATHAILKVLININNFIKGSHNKGFGQAMFQKALPYFEGEEKARVQKMLDDIDNM